MYNNNLTIDSIINMLKTYINLTDYTLITKSFNYVKNYIDDLNTLNDYLEIASILTTVYADIETISSSFLYHLLVLEKVTDKDNIKYGLSLKLKWAFSSLGDFLISLLLLNI